MMNRRHLLTTTAALPLIALTACAAQPAQPSARIVTALQAVVTGLQNLAAVVESAGIAPNLLRPIQTALAAAQQALAAWQMPGSGSASLVQEVINTIEALVSIAAQIPGLPAQAKIILSALAAIIPLIQSLVSGLSAHTRLYTLAPYTMTSEQALCVLQGALPEFCGVEPHP